MPRGERHPARRPEHHHHPRLAHRRPHHPPPRLRGLLRVRKRIEEGFGWVKEVARLAQVSCAAWLQVDAAFVLGLAAYNLVRLPKLLAEASP
jgi:hypothetical protein